MHELPNNSLGLCRTTSAGEKLGRMVRLLGIEREERLAVWLIAQQAWNNALRRDR